MKFLFISNFYPPSGRGGYEQWCREIADGLHRRGHEVAVLTSRHGHPSEWVDDQPNVHRALYLEMELTPLKNSLMFFFGRRARQQHNLDKLTELVETFHPDAVLVWGMWNLSRTLPAAAETLLPGRVAYYMGDYWPSLPSQAARYWEVPARGWVSAIPKALLRSAARRRLAAEPAPVLNFEHVLFPTKFLQQELAQTGFKPRHTALVRGAVETGRFAHLATQKKESWPAKKRFDLLFIGRVEEEKGVHTAVEALKELHQRGYSHVFLKVVGPPDPPYQTRLSQLAADLGIEEAITFLGARPIDTMADFYAAADVFLFTSIWPEPFGRVIIEAMAAGVAVVGTPVGGAAEILRHGENALTYRPNQPASLADQIGALIDSPELKTRLEAAGLQTARSTFDLGRMTEEIEGYLTTISTAAAAQAAL